MTEQELDQMLNRWQAPAPPSRLRARVLDAFPRHERPGFGGRLRWAMAMAVVLGMLAIGSAQTGRGALDNLAMSVHQFGEHLNHVVDHVWLAHIVAAFRNSKPKIYVDGDLQSDAVFGGSGAGLWLRMPGEGKYYLLLNRAAIEGPAPEPAGRFDGHVLEFQAGGRAVRIEASRTYGFGIERPVYVMGPRADR